MRQAAAHKDPAVGRSRRADTPLASPCGEACCLDQSATQPLLAEKIPLGIGYPVDGVQKPISL